YGTRVAPFRYSRTTCPKLEPRLPPPLARTQPASWPSSFLGLLRFGFRSVLPVWELPAILSARVRLSSSAHPTRCCLLQHCHWNLPTGCVCETPMEALIPKLALSPCNTTAHKPLSQRGSRAKSLIGS